MDNASWSAAVARLDLARQRLAEFESLRAPDNASALGQAWEGFLTELGRAFNKLFHGELAGSASASTIKRIRDDRGSDPLLVYLRESRNALEHGIEALSAVGGVARPVTGADVPPPAGKPAIVFSYVDEEGNDLPKLIVDEWSPILLPFKLGGRSYDVPTVHLGEAIPTPTPVAVARAALIYLEGRLRELEPLLDRG